MAQCTPNVRPKHDSSFERELGTEAYSHRGEPIEDAGKDRHSLENVGSIPMVSLYGAETLTSVLDEDVG